MLGTIVIKMAIVANCSIVPSNILLTEEASSAANKLIVSQSERRRVLFSTGPKVSSSSSIPAIPIMECSASSRITSTTSSIVIRPSSLPSPSTTGADTQSLRSNFCATSLSDMLTGILWISGSMMLRIVVLGAQVSRSASLTPPSTLSCLSTTYKVSVVSGRLPLWRR